MVSLGSAGLQKCVAVIGAGPLGLIATKNLVEEAFQVTTFERTQYVGGLWKPTANISRTSVLPGTITNTSKFTGAMTDFPMPDSYPIYPSATQIQEYFESYCDAFDLRKNIRFDTEVLKVTRDPASLLWQVHYRAGDDGQVQTGVFDRLVIATGAFSKPTIPNFAGLDKFTGEVLHSQAFKDPEKYKGKNVLVVGAGSTAADSVTALAKAGVARLAVSHRHKLLILPRFTQDGKVLELTLSFRLLLLIFYLQKLSQSIVDRIMTHELKQIERDNFPGLAEHPVKADSRVLPAIDQLMPTVSDDLAGHFTSGRVGSMHGIKEITGPNSVRFADGKEMHDIDLILMCTGLTPDLASSIPYDVDPFNPSLAPKVFAKLPEEYKRDRLVPHLYQGFISPRCPHQLAFLGSTFAKRPAFQLYDLMTMALAQLWSGNSPMPSQREIDRVADADVEHIAHMAKSGEVKMIGVMEQIEFDQWLNKVAGTGLYAHLGSWTSVRCWKLWWQDRELYQMLMGGIISTHALRLFDGQGGRKPWPQARDAIVKANRDAATWTPAKSKGLW